MQYFPSAKSHTFHYVGQDEMCYGFLTFYPVENGPKYCISYFDTDDGCLVESAGASHAMHSKSLCVAALLGFVQYYL